MESVLGFHHLDTDLNTERYLVQDPIRDLNSGLSFGGGFEALRERRKQTGILSPRYRPEYRQTPLSGSH
ncbi:unnamed protein product [Sphagnum troendelagicum]|uniref:NADH-plastoquinone oxidoreductase subunit K n=1 Tax=Sphagnum troendelagicum TaxID=128251 RepID=A0ABP0TY48_9BRYO